MAAEWTKETLKTWMLARYDEGQQITTAHRAVLTRGLLFLYSRQTADEQVQGATSHSNGMGFSGVDAQFLTSVAKSAKQYGNITPGQAPHVAKKLAKYTGQLLELVNAA